MISRERSINKIWLNLKNIFFANNANEQIITGKIKPVNETAGPKIISTINTSIRIFELMHL